MEQHGQVVFGGNGYSPDWHREAVEKRGLRNLRTSAEALPVFKEKPIIELFESDWRAVAEGIDTAVSTSMPSNIFNRSRLKPSLSSISRRRKSIRRLSPTSRTLSRAAKASRASHDNGLGFAVETANDDDGAMSPN